MKSNKLSRKISLIISIGGLIFIVIFFAITHKKNLSTIPANSNTSTAYKNYQTNIITEVQQNTDFRRVLFTGLNSQLVVMNIPPGQEIGEEMHQYTEQTLFFLSGIGEGKLNDNKFPIGPGDVVVVSVGTKHNFWNTGTKDLKLYTIYAPPNHLNNRVQQTKKDADADTADKAVGKIKPIK